jgi:hypothetical protein
MIARLSTRLIQANKLLIVSKRNSGVFYQFGPPRNKLSNGVNISNTNY